MDDLNFDKLFSDKMRQAGAPDHSEEDWERLTPRLVKQERERWRLLPLWWLGALSGLLLCSNLGWWSLWRQSTQRAESLHTEWQQQTKQVVQHDTIWQKVVVIQYDTVYRTIVRQSAADRGSVQNRLVNNRFVDPSRQSGTGYVPNAPLPPSTASQQQPVREDVVGQLTSMNAKLVTEIQLLRDSIFWDSMSATVMVALPAPTLQPFPSVPPVYSRAPLPMLPARRVMPREPLLQPRFYRLGLVAGAVLPDAPNLEAKNGYAFGANGEIGFSEQLSLSVELMFNSLAFRGRNDASNLGMPPLVPAQDNFVLESFDLYDRRKRSWQTTIGMLYHFLPRQRWQPYLGVGYTTQFPLRYEVYATFRDPQTATPLLDEYYFSKGKPLSYGNVQLGVSRQLSRKWRWDIGGFLQQEIVRNQNGIDRYWGLKSGLSYRF